MDNTFKRELKAQAHHLKPVVRIGAKGLTDGVIAETDIALKTHELIKVKIYGAEREDRQLMTTQLCEATGASFVQLIGNTAILYRKNED